MSSAHWPYSPSQLPFWNPLHFLQVSRLFFISDTAVFNNSHSTIPSKSLLYQVESPHLVWNPISISELWKLILIYLITLERRKKRCSYNKGYLHSYYKKGKNTARFCWQMISNYTRTLCEAVVNILWNKWMGPGRLNTTKLDPAVIYLYYLPHS
jgi:hypothetical protein